MSSVVEEPPRKIQKCCGNAGGCLRGCLNKVPVNVRKELQTKLKQEILKSTNESYSFLRKFMSGREIHANCNQHRRHAVWTYYAPSSSDATELGDRVEICQRAFREIFGVSERFIRNARDEEALRIRKQTTGQVMTSLAQDNALDTTSPPRLRQQNHDLAHLRTIFNWSEHQIWDRTLQILFEEGFTSRMAMEAINEDDLKYLRKKTDIKSGQISLLRQVLKLMQAETNQRQGEAVQQPNSSVAPSNSIPEQSLHLPTVDSLPEHSRDLLSVDPSEEGPRPSDSERPPEQLQHSLPGGAATENSPDTSQVQHSQERTPDSMTTEHPVEHLQAFSSAGSSTVNLLNSRVDPPPRPPEHSTGSFSLGLSHENLQGLIQAGSLEVQAPNSFPGDSQPQQFPGNFRQTFSGRFPHSSLTQQVTSSSNTRNKIHEGAEFRNSKGYKRGNNSLETSSTGNETIDRVAEDSRVQDTVASLFALSGHAELPRQHNGQREIFNHARVSLLNSPPLTTIDRSNLSAVGIATQGSFEKRNNVSVASPAAPAAASLQILPGNNSVRSPTDMDEVKEWRLVKEYKGGRKARFEMVSGIAVASNGDIVVADLDKDQVHLFSAKCVYKLTLTSPSSDTKAKLVYPSCPCDVAVTSHSCIVVVDRSKYVKVFDENGVYSRSFCTLTEDEDPDTSVWTASVVASSQGNILVGDYERHLVTIHSETDGNIIGKVNVNGGPYYLAVTSKQTILTSSDLANKKVVAYDLSGNTGFNIDTWMLDGKSGAWPLGLTCDSEDNIYIAVYAGYYTSHIHMYNNRGKYMRCIAKGLYYPHGITWCYGSLYVANMKSILIYNTV